jgi:glycosyltransferase involved in cell wall biosynthesis
MLWYLPPAILLLLWVGLAWDRGRQMRRIPRLHDIPLPELLTDLPRLSVVIAARNEERRLPACLDSLLASDCPDMEVILVNDRSTDSTGEIAEDYAVKWQSRLNALHIEEVPPGWLGKCHALSTGAAQATGEYVLFTDADVLFDRRALAHALAHAQTEQADQLVVLPDMITYSFLERVLTTAFALLFVARFRPWRAMQRRTPEYVGAGAFNLVRRRMYQRIGGHRFLRMHVVDDLALGKLVKYSGGTVRLLVANGMVRVRWQESFGQTITGLEKNAFAAMNYSVTRTLVASALLVLMFWWPYVGLAFGPPLARLFCAAAAVAQIALTYAGFRSVQRTHFVYAVTVPLGVLFLAWAMVRSMITTLRNGGIRWRDSFYPLHQVRKYKL